MAFQTANKVVYGDAEYEVNGTEYCDIEDKCEAIDKVFGLSESDKDAAKEWITYNVLINAGHFVSQPDVPEPDLSKVFNEPEERIVNERFVDRPAFEPVWTQSKILLEREKLLRAKEQLFEQRVRAELRRQKAVTAPTEFYHEDGRPYTKGDYTKTVTSLFVVILLLIAAMIICSAGR